MSEDDLFVHGGNRLESGTVLFEIDSHPWYVQRVDPHSLTVTACPCSIAGKGTPIPRKGEIRNIDWPSEGGQYLVAQTD